MDCHQLPENIIDWKNHWCFKLNLKVGPQYLHSVVERVSWKKPWTIRGACIFTPHCISHQHLSSNAHHPKNIAGVIHMYITPLAFKQFDRFSIKLTDPKRFISYKLKLCWILSINRIAFVSKWHPFKFLNITCILTYKCYCINTLIRLKKVLYIFFHQPQQNESYLRFVFFI